MPHAPLVLIPWARPTHLALFEAHPSLYGIWAHELSVIASEHTRLWECHEDATGEVLLAYSGDVLVGITGWWHMSETVIGLRWHGVLPAFRRQGFSHAMLRLLYPRLPTQSTSLYEITRNEKSAEAFQRCGFDVITDPELIEWVMDDANYDLPSGGWVLRKNLIPIPIRNPNNSDSH